MVSRIFLPFVRRQARLLADLVLVHAFVEGEGPSHPWLCRACDVKPLESGGLLVYQGITEWHIRQQAASAARDLSPVALAIPAGTVVQVTKADLVRRVFERGDLELAINDSPDDRLRPGNKGKGSVCLLHPSPEEIEAVEMEPIDERLEWNLLPANVHRWSRIQ